jgi:hypothetical protein
MANCHEHFTDYNEKIRLTDARRKTLKGSRKELRKKVRKWFKENKPDEIQPKFSGQGSLLTDVIINPILRKIIEGKEEKAILYYDVDDGIYFEGNVKKEERISPETYHKWICEAVDGHTNTPPVDKDTCVRTLFADGHNIDQPIYFKQGDIPELAHKAQGYIFSDPKAMVEWFNEKAEANSQLRLLVRYAKGWADCMDFKNDSREMPCGLILTILITENAIYRERDDVAFKETLINIQAVLDKEFTCKRPTTPAGENLLANYKHKDYFMAKLAELISDATKALQEKNIRKATELWRNHLSDRFPLGEVKDEVASNNAGLRSIIPPTTKPYAS